MVREMKEVLKLLGWEDGFKIPMANEENKELERQVEELLKKKAEALVQLEVINDQENVMKKHLKTMAAEKIYNQTLLNSLQKQLDNDMLGIKSLECESNKQAAEIKEIKKEIADMNNNIKKTKGDITHYSTKMNSLKESLQWGEDALFAWEEELAKGEKEMEFLETYRLQDEENFKKLDLERSQVESDLMEAKVLEQREADRQQILQSQLENISKLYKEAYNEKKRLTKVWLDSAVVIRNREADIQRLEQILCDVKNKARSKCIELYEQKGFHEEINNMNNNISKEIYHAQMQYGKFKETVVELENATKHYKNEVDLRKRASGSLSNKLESQRMKNAELTEKNKSRLKKYSKLVEENIRLKEQCDLLKVDSMSTEQKYKNAETMYEMSCKASAEDTKELERLNYLILQLKQELTKLKEKHALLQKELSYSTKSELDLITKLRNEENKHTQLEESIATLRIEESVLAAKLIELQNKCINKEEKEELEKEIAELQSKEGDLMKEENKINQHIKSIQKEYKDYIKMLKNGEDEIKALEENLFSMKRNNEFEKKEAEKMKEEINKLRLQLNLLMMKESYSEDNIARDDNTLNRLERQRIILETAMKERRMEINAQREMLLGKKRSLMEERSLLKRTIEHLNLRIKQIQSRFAVSMDLLGKDESGHSLSVAHFKIKLAQEKYELQLRGDDLEAQINKTEKEIQAMENTLKLLSSANENYKISLETIDVDDPDIKEKERIDQRYLEVKRVMKEDSDIIKSVKHEIEELIDQISFVKRAAKALEEDWKQKEKEISFLDKELAMKHMKTTRAAEILMRAIKEVQKSKEPPTYKKLAQKEIDIRIQDERNKSVLHQLAELIVNYLETKPIVLRYLGEHGLTLPTCKVTKSKLMSFTSVVGPDTARSRVSNVSDSSTSIVNLDPNLIFKGMPTCLFPQKN